MPAGCWRNTLRCCGIPVGSLKVGSGTRSFFLTHKFAHRCEAVITSFSSLPADVLQAGRKKERIKMTPNVATSVKYGVALSCMELV